MKLRNLINNYSKVILHSLANLRRKAEACAYLPIFIAGLGFIVYGLQASNYIISSKSILDEGLYLLKGYYFAIGKYAPFQDYGVLTNHMPLSFVIPGLFQDWFGPGLLVGRIYSFGAGMLALGGIWLAAKRLGGKWWAAFAVWAMALNVSLVKTYSVAFSQVLIALLFSWLLAFAIGRETIRWQIIAAGVLGGLLIMTRINMAPVAILLIVYVYFQHGWNEASIALGAFLLVVVSIHVIYWPDIQRIWAYWIPEGWFAQLDDYFPPWRNGRSYLSSPFNAWIRNLDDKAWRSIGSFWDGFRFNFVALFGVITNLVLWPKATKKKQGFQLRAAIFLNGLFLVLLAIHGWASLSGASCHAFCFSGYVAFFNFVGILAIISGAPYWRRNNGWVRGFVSLAIILIVFSGLGYGSSDVLGKWFAELEIPQWLVQTSGNENATMWGLIENRFGFEYQISRRFLPAIAGFLAAVAFIGIIFVWLKKNSRNSLTRFAYTAMTSALVLGFVLSPIVLMGGGDGNLDCSGNVVANYEDIASKLQKEIPDGARVYYHASNSPIALLYLENVQIYPPQLNNTFSYSDELGPAFSDELLRFGLWNQDLLESWRAEADYVLTEGRHFGEWQDDVEAGIFSIELVTEPLEQCRGNDSQLIVLHRQN
jgi:hypothetical protein